MQYIRHNFLKNYSNAVKSKDNRLANDMLLDEIAKMVVFERQKLCSTLKINSSASNTMLTKQVLKKAKDNPKVRQSLVNMIITKNDYAVDKAADFSFDGKGLYKNTNAKGIIDKEKMFIHQSLSKSLSVDGGFDMSDIENKSTQHDKNRVSILGNLDGTKDFNYDDFKSIATKTVLLIGLGTAVFYLAQRYFTNKLFADGGEVEQGEQQPLQPVNNEGQGLQQQQMGVGNLEQQQVSPQPNQQQGWQPETAQHVALIKKLNVDKGVTNTTDTDVLQ